MIQRTLLRIYDMRTILVLTLLGLLLGGCGRREPPRADGMAIVKGMVKLDNEPLKEGRISFVDPENPRNPETVFMSSVWDGKYETEVPLGSWRVEIVQFQMPKPGEWIEGAYPQLLPARYNTKSDIVEQVKDGDNVFNYELTSAAK